MGAGQGAGNASLAGLGGHSITDVSQALVAAAVPVQPRGTTS
jgi:hypothetical protein